MKKPKFTDVKRYPRPYIPSGSTNIEKTFAIIRARQRAEAEAKATVHSNVTDLSDIFKAKKPNGS